MRGYKDVEVRHADQFFDAFEEAVPVAVELRRNAESLIDFVHPEQALYVFGPEGETLAFVKMPGDPTNCAFGEPGVLYITGQGPEQAGKPRRFALFRIRLTP